MADIEEGQQPASDQQAPPAEASQPAAEKKPPQKRTDAEERFKEYQRRKDREVAEARREAKDSSTRLSEVQRELDESRSLLAEIREQSRFGDDDEARVKARLAKERDLADREERARAYERTVTIRALSNEYGIPAEDLEPYDDPRDMKIRALEWSVQNRAALPPEPDDEQDEPAPARTMFRERESEAPSGNRFDMGNGAVPQKSVADMSKAEFEALRARNKAAARRRMTSQR